MTIHEAETFSRQHALLFGERANSAAFIKLMTLCRPLNIFDDDKALDSWRQEKFIHEGAD